METSFLLITNAAEKGWLTTLEETLAPLGSLRIATKKGASEEFLKQPYELVIIDATTVEEPVLVAKTLHTLKPNVRIAVMTTVPTWQEARDILRAGVVDYFPRTLSSRELLVTIKTILQEEINNEPNDDSTSR